MLCLAGLVLLGGWCADDVEYGRHCGIAARIALMTAGPPWMWSSKMSSPVKDVGPGKDRSSAEGSRISSVVGW